MGPLPDPEPKSEVGERLKGRAAPQRDFLIFSLDRRLFALELDRVVQIVGEAQVVVPPQRLPGVEGIFEFRGVYIPLLNLRLRLGLEGSGPGSAIVILEERGQPLGLWVDSVIRVGSFNPEAASAPPPRLQGVRSEFLRGIFSFQGRPLLWMDDRSLFGPQREGCPDG
jgi:chemotaxis signal transduction protein